MKNQTLTTIRILISKLLITVGVVVLVSTVLSAQAPSALAQSFSCYRAVFTNGMTIRPGGFATLEACRLSNLGTKPIPNGSCTTSCPYGDGCACPSYCNNIGAIDFGQNCGGNFQLQCTTNTNRPVGCGCDTTSQCASFNCGISTSGTRQCLPSGFTSCSVQSGRPNDCACATSPQCASGLCSQGICKVPPTSTACSPNTGKPEDCLCTSNSQCASNRCDVRCLPPVGGGNVGNNCNPSSGTSNSVDVGGECCGGGVLECRSGQCSAAEGVVGVCQVGGGGGPPSGQGKGEGDQCNPSANECASPLRCGTPCPANTVKAGQTVCWGMNYSGACGGLNVPGRECTTLDRTACGDPECGGATTRQRVCNIYGKWECLHTDRCGATGNKPNCPPETPANQCNSATGCVYDSSCAGGYCDRDGNPAVCRPTLGTGSTCNRHTQCSSQYCNNQGRCDTHPTGQPPASCGQYGHGKFMGCGNLYGLPADWDCFCYNGQRSCAYDADRQSCAAPAGTPTPTPTPTVGPTPTPPPTSPPTPTPTPTPTPPITYHCNSTCSTDAQCQTADSRFVCADTEQGRRCRLNTNLTSSQCRPPSGPQCLSIRMVDPVTNVDLTEDPVAGQTLRFICGQVNGAARYIFRVLEPGNANPVILQATGTISQNYTVPSTPGRYIAQCQICTEGTDADRNNASCHPFENPTQNTLQGAIERASLEGSGTSIEEPVLETNNALQEEVGTNDALPLVEPNAVNGEDNPEEPAAANALQENEVQQEPENGNGSNGLDTSAQEAVTNNPDVAPPEQE